MVNKEIAGKITSYLKENGASTRYNIEKYLLEKAVTHESNHAQHKMQRIPSSRELTQVLRDLGAKHNFDGTWEM